MTPSLPSARGVTEVLQQRIINGVYPPGRRLPSVRQLAAEFGCSPATAGRALQELERTGWVRVRSRQRAVVAQRLPDPGVGNGNFEEALRQLALRWKLSGASGKAFQELVARIEHAVFQPAWRTVFLECNREDLDRMAATVRMEIVPDAEALLIQDAETDPRLLRSAVVLTPFFHLSEVRRLAPRGAEVVPLNFVPASDALFRLASLNEGARVGVIAANERSRRRLEGIAHQYSPALVESATVGHRAAVERLLETSDAILTVAAVALPAALAAKAKRMIKVEWVLDPASTQLALLRLHQLRPLAAASR